MNKFVVSTKKLVAWVALVALAGVGSAWAADIPVKAPVLEPPAWAADPVPMFGDYAVRIPVISVKRGAFKIGENESPRPADRVYLNYNYYDGVRRDLGVGTENDHRYTLGFEKTVLSGNGSVGLRLPFFQGLDGNDFNVGDLSLLLKYALLNDKQSGSALSVGLVATLPTGAIPHRFDVLKDKNIHSALLQPYVGWVWGTGNFFLHGFHSIMVPTTSDDVTILFNSIGVGYWSYRAPPKQFITGVIPTIELHVNTPLNHRVGDTPQVYRDVVNLTVGSHVQIRGRYLFGIAVSTPVRNPRPYDFEVIANFSMRF